jgi:hypothetical protein
LEVCVKLGYQIVFLSRLPRFGDSEIRLPRDPACFNANQSVLIKLVALIVWCPAAISLSNVPRWAVSGSLILYFYDEGAFFTLRS